MAFLTMKTAKGRKDMRKSMGGIWLAIGLAASIAASRPASAEDYALTIENHKFTPDTLEIPANTKVRVVIRNKDTTPEEFDSDDLHREKLIPGGSEAVVFIGPLNPGTYAFMGEFHSATAKGKVVVKP